MLATGTFFVDRQSISINRINRESVHISLKIIANKEVIKEVSRLDQNVITSENNEQTDLFRQ